MNRTPILRYGRLKVFCALLFLAFTPMVMYGQTMIVNLVLLDGLELTPNNVFNYQIQNNSNKAEDVIVTGTIRYKGSDMHANYHFNHRLVPGNNRLSVDMVRSPQWQFSSNALKELFLQYGKLPQGTYEYCVSVSLASTQGEQASDIPASDCIYQTVNDLFLINLVDPEDEAEIYEHYPVLSWVVNYPFASALTYKVRVSERKDGQNKEQAITRNNPIYTEKNAFQTSLVYPVTAKPLQVGQPYVWTVDAYYKGILLGGAAPWQFTIIEDSLLKSIPVTQSYYAFEEHYAETRVYAIGTLKLKYTADKMNDTLEVHIYDQKDKEISTPYSKLSLKNGVNKLDLVFQDKVSLKHNKKYKALIRLGGKNYEVPFLYINPMYLKNNETNE